MKNTIRIRGAVAGLVMLIAMLLGACDDHAAGNATDHGHGHGHEQGGTAEAEPGRVISCAGTP